MSIPAWITISIIAAEFLVRVGLTLRVILRRRPPGVTMAWMTLILLVPLIGTLIYILIGENRLARKRADKEVLRQPPYTALKKEMCDAADEACSRLKESERRLESHARALTGLCAQGGNTLELIDDAKKFLQRLAADVDTARKSCLMEFYIWTDQDLAGKVNQALIRAAKRGVDCRVLLDAIGARPFLASPSAQALRDAGVKLVEALPVGLVRVLFARADLRSHHKSAVIDGDLAYIGSANMVDPRDFKLSAGVGQWVDAMVRVRGPLATALAAAFLFSWELETGEPSAVLLNDLTHREPSAGNAVVQLIPSGPGLTAGAYLKVLVAAVYAAQKEVLLTTPYFVPDESLHSALAAAAHRGVRVSLTVPRRSDIRSADAAAHAFYEDLLDAGVEIHLYKGGLLHTKAVTIDREFCFFGTSNLDMRSFWLNFEHTVAIYDDRTTKEIRDLQIRYEKDAVSLNARAYRKRSIAKRLVESVAYAFSPVL